CVPAAAICMISPARPCGTDQCRHATTIVTRNDLLFTMSDITRLSHPHETIASRVHMRADVNLFSLDEFVSAARLRRSYGGQSSFPTACQSKLRRSEDWWSQTGSNRRPPACKAGALPAELWPRKSVQQKLVGLGRFELPTSRLSSARSNQLSYKPE